MQGEINSGAAQVVYVKQSLVREREWERLQGIMGEVYLIKGYVARKKDATRLGWSAYEKGDVEVAGTADLGTHMTVGCWNKRWGDELELGF